MNEKKSLFLGPDGKSLVFTFALVSSLFLLWGLCNGMIDVMDKHFQEELSLSKAQSAWVQFAHYLGYFLMSLPAGWLAIKLGYKGGIIAGLLIVAVGGFWFIPATGINNMVHEGRVSANTAFVAYLAGVCAIAAGLTFLETIANPYTTVLGDKRFAATRINLAQSCNGIGWIFGPIIGSMFFYSKDAAGHSTGSQTLYIPYLGVAIVVIVLAAIFYFANVPDIKTEDDYHLDNSTPGASHSIWKHPHFSMAVAAQFFYVAAQAGIFSFFINYMTAEVPAIPESWNTGLASVAGSAGPLRDWLSGWFEMSKSGVLAISDKGASNLASLGFVCFLIGRFSGAGILRKYSAHKVVGLYGVMNVAMCFLIFLKLGWFSVACVFLSYFFMSIMFPTIFALGIFGLGARAKKASAFIVMAIMGGAILPKLMGYVADKFDMSRGFIVPMFCFAFVAFYGYNWPKFSKAESLDGVKVSAGTKERQGRLFWYPDNHPEVIMQVTVQPSVARSLPRESPPVALPVVRNVAVDAYRGFVMLLMMAEVLQLSRVAQAFPGNSFWSFLAYNQSHVPWSGCSLHDTIQPGFSFLVGVALPYSIASRIAKGGTFGKMFLHALWRSLLLVALGVFLRSTHSPQTYFTFEDTLSQIGFGYPLLFLLGFRPPRWQWAALAVVLGGYWLAWALYPLPAPGFNYQAVGVPADWTHNYSGFMAHWNKNANFGNAFDQWFLNLFPRVQPFVFNGGGYLTLSFIPTLGTMILGLVAGRWLRASAPRIPMQKLLVAAAAGIAAGLLLHFAGICPIVKRIWTPSWTLFSGGICFLFLAAFSWVVDMKGYRKWAFPLVVIGMNSIFAYLIAHLWERFVIDSFRIHLGAHFFAFFGTGVEPLMRGAAVLLVFWAILYWMYKRKIYLRI